MISSVQIKEDIASSSAQPKRSVSLNPALVQLSKSKNVLLLQGPLGAFYDRLTCWLQARDSKVHRVVFQGGDRHDCKSLTPIEYRGTRADWPAFLDAQIRDLEIDCLVLFGQSRAYHAHALVLSQAGVVPVIVLEEGYFRPGFMTMELGGVNGFSKTMQQYVWQPVDSLEDGCSGQDSRHKILPDISKKHFLKMAWQAARHYYELHRYRADFPNYIHHRKENPYEYMAYWIRSWMRKFIKSPADFRFQKLLFKNSRPYYFVPLQHDGDAQIVHHSPFSENTDFIIRVLRSFASSAPNDALLVFRQHPHSRGGPGHSAFISSLAVELGVSERVHHMVEGDTPELAERSAGVVVINSTVGLQALERGAPLMALGEALYKQPQLTFFGEIDTFWHYGRSADKVVALNFLVQMKNLTQVPVSAYALRSEPIFWAH